MLAFLQQPPFSINSAAIARTAASSVTPAAVAAVHAHAVVPVRRREIVRVVAATGRTPAAEPTSPVSVTVLVGLGRDRPLEAARERQSPVLSAGEADWEIRPSRR